MIRLVHVELLKLRSVRSTYGLLAAAAVLTLADAALIAGQSGSSTRPPLSAAAGLQGSISTIGFALLMSWVLGTTVSSGEFRHRTATLTYLAAPHRSRVLAAKAMAAACVGTVFGAVGAVLTTGVSLAFVAGHGYTVALAATTIAGYALGAVVGCALIAALGVAIGSFVRAQLPAVVAILLWGFFVESTLSNQLNALGPYLPFTAATTLGGARLATGGFGFPNSSSASPLPFLAAVAVLAGITAAVSALAARTTVRSDVS
jgi:ABC-type transport system involved in multi-copper enzyme maturation permease subunit